VKLVGNMKVSKSLSRRFAGVRLVLIFYTVFASVILLFQAAAVIDRTTVAYSAFPQKLVSYIMIAAIVLFVALYSIWLYGFHRDLQTFDDSYPISGAWAVQRFLIPFYNIWGIWSIYSTYRYRLMGSPAPKLQSLGCQLRALLVSFYIILVMTRIVHVALTRKSATAQDSLWRDLAESALNLSAFPLWLRMTTIMQTTIFAVAQTGKEPNQMQEP
jgi:hypothetical protein